jgi:hypothetical protein
MGQNYKKKREKICLHDTFFMAQNVTLVPKNSVPKRLSIKKIQTFIKIRRNSRKKPMPQKNLVPDFGPAQDVEKLMLVASLMMAQTQIISSFAVHILDFSANIHLLTLKNFQQ